MSDKTGFEIALSEIFEEPSDNPSHPFITIARFIFADDKPNENGMAVDFSEFENIKRTAIGMPVKMLFTGAGVSSHPGSTPIGVIRGMTQETLPDNSHRLIADAVLWPEEFPDEVSYLKTAFAEGKAPGISYELGYKDSITKNGIKWLKNVITLAATFVKNPAYGTRTPLLALAADATLENFATTIIETAKRMGISLEDLIDQLETMSGDTEDTMPEDDMQETEAAVWSAAYENDLPDSCFAYIEPGGKKDSSGKTTPRSLRHLPYKDKSGKIDLPHLRNALARVSQTDIPASAKAAAKAKLQAAAKKVGVGQASSNDEGGNQMEEELQQAKAEAASLGAEIEALKAQLLEKDAAYQTAQDEIKSLKQAALIDSRTRKFVEAGFTLEADAEKVEKKKTLWASLTDDQFEEYIADMVSAKTSASPAVSTSPALAAIAHASAQNSMPRLEIKETDIISLVEESRRLARPYSA